MCGLHLQNMVPDKVQGHKRVHTVGYMSLSIQEFFFFIQMSPLIIKNELIKMNIWEKKNYKGKGKLGYSAVSLIFQTQPHPKPKIKSIF